MKTLSQVLAIIFVGLISYSSVLAGDTYNIERQYNTYNDSNRLSPDERRFVRERTGPGEYFHDSSVPFTNYNLPKSKTTRRTKGIYRPYIQRNPHPDINPKDPRFDKYWFPDRYDERSDLRQKRLRESNRYLK